MASQTSSVTSMEVHPGSIRGEPRAGSDHFGGKLDQISVLINLLQLSELSGSVASDDDDELSRLSSDSDLQPDILFNAIFDYHTPRRRGAGRHAPWQRYWCPPQSA